jgi:Zn-dependent metalloprotease
MYCRYCSIIPNDVLRKLEGDGSYTATIDAEVRKVRNQAMQLTRVSQAMAPQGFVADAIAAAPKILVYDCKHTTNLPGTPVAKPGSSPDGSTKRCFVETTAVAEFYRKIFGRNSVDGAGMALLSSVNYGSNYNNANWNGSQMIYGDGDNQIFVDFTKSNDVIGHELTHGVTQYTLQLVYANESGGLNESMSDVFGSMFRQWRKNQTVTQADWLIGHEIMGPKPKAQGITCLRDMANPGSNHCLAPQPFHFSNYTPGMDPHYSSGIPNYAFYKAAMAIGGKSWEKAGQIWYRAMTAGKSPNMKMSTFAKRTRDASKSLYPGNTKVINAIDAAWKQVGL